MGPLLVALALAAPAEPTSAELALVVDVARDGAAFRGVAAGASATAVDVGGRFTLWPTPVRDDATPIALQPFLQRRTAITLAVGGGSLATAGAPIFLGELARAARRGHAGLVAEMYVARWLALSAGVGYRYDRYPGDERRDVIAWRGGAALRLGDLRVAAGVDGAGVFTTRTDNFVRGFVEVRVVMVGHIDLAVAASFRAKSGDATLHLDYYPSRHLGLLAGVFGGRNRDEFPDTGAAAALAGHDPIGSHGDHLGFIAGFSYWPSPSLGVGATWLPAWVAGVATGASDQRVLLTLVGRAF